MSEPVRKSVYELLISSLKLAGRKTFIHRYVYIANHKGESQIEELFQRIVKSVNENYCEEVLTGLLLLYSNYFVHIIDGCEDAIIKLVQMMYDEGEHLLGEVKILLIYNHINQRFFDEWGVRRAKPPILLEKINPALEFEDTKRYIFMCISKAYKLAINLRIICPEEKPEQITIGEITPEMSEFLPEYNLLEFLLHSSYVLALDYFKRVFHCIPPINFYPEIIWPVRNDFVPFDVFDEKKDPVQSLTNVTTK